MWEKQVQIRENANIKLQKANGFCTEHVLKTYNVHSDDENGKSKITTLQSYIQNSHIRN